MKFLGFDLAALFKAPVVTEEPVIPEPQEPMPVEYNEIDATLPDLWDDNTGPQEPDCDDIHQQMYDMSCPPACTVKRDEIENPWTLGGSEEIHK